MDINDTYTYDKYRLDVDIDPRSRSQGQRSKSNMKLGKKSVLTIYSDVPNNHIAQIKVSHRKTDKKLIKVSGPNKHIAGETLKFTGLNYLRLCHYFITTSKYKKMMNSNLCILFFISFKEINK